MKVVAVTTFNSACGISHYSEALYSAIRASGPDVDVWRVDDGPIEPVEGSVVTRTIPRNRDAGITVDDFKGVDVFHLQHEFNFWFEAAPVLSMLQAARSAGCKTVVTIHTPVPGGLQFHTLFKGLNDLADVVVTLGPKGAKQLRDWGHPNVVCVPHGVTDMTAAMSDPDRLTMFQRLRAAGFTVYDDGCPVILAFGFIGAQKRLGDLIEASVAVKKRAQVLIVGGVPERELGAKTYVAALKDAVVSEDLSTTLRIVDRYVDDTTRHYLHAVADAAVITRVGNSESASLAQAVGYGLPLIVRRDGASVVDSESALTFHEVDELKACLQRIVDSKDARVQLGLASRRLADEWSWPKVAERHTEEVYRK